MWHRQFYFSNTIRSACNLTKAVDCHNGIHCMTCNSDRFSFLFFSLCLSSRTVNCVFIVAYFVTSHFKQFNVNRREKKTFSAYIPNRDGWILKQRMSNSQFDWEITTIKMMYCHLIHGILNIVIEHEEHHTKLSFFFHVKKRIFRRLRWHRNFSSESNVITKIKTTRNRHEAVVEQQKNNGKHFI